MSVSASDNGWREKSWEARRAASCNSHTRLQCLQQVQPALSASASARPRSLARTQLPRLLRRLLTGGEASLLRERTRLSPSRAPRLASQSARPSSR